MVKVYCTLIVNKRRTFDLVPDDMKEAVKQKLAELGYDTDGNPLK